MDIMSDVILKEKCTFTLIDGTIDGIVQCNTTICQSCISIKIPKNKDAIDMCKKMMYLSVVAFIFLLHLQRAPTMIGMYILDRLLCIRMEREFLTECLTHILRLRIGLLP